MSIVGTLVHESVIHALPKGAALLLLIGWLLLYWLLGTGHVATRCNHEGTLIRGGRPLLIR